MHITMIAAVGAALGLSTLAYQRSQPAQPLAPPAAQPTTQPGDTAGASQELSLEVRADPSGELLMVPVLRDIPIVSRFFTSTDEAGVSIETAMQGPEDLDSLLHFLAESQGLRAYIHWRDLDGVAQQDEEVDELPLQGQSADRAFEMVNDNLGLEGAQRIAFRTDNGLLEVATQRFFDRRDQELVTYDVSGLLNADQPLEVTDESGVLVELITQIIEPDSWTQNGGDVGSIFAAGDKLFVSGPPRLQERVAWLLTKLMDGGEEHASAREQALQQFVVSALAAADPTATPSTDLARAFDGAQVDPRRLDGAVVESLRDAAASRVGMFSLRSSAAAELAPILAGALAPLGGTVDTDPRANALLVQGPDNVQQKAEAIIRALDRDPNEADIAPPAAGEPTSLRVRGEPGRVVAEVVGRDGRVSRLEAGELVVTAEGFSRMRATGGSSVETAPGRVQ